MRVLVAYNPVSGRGVAKKLGADISDVLLHEGCDVELVPTQADDPQNWLEPRLKQIDRVVAVGGDGTLRSIASCLVGTGDRKSTRLNSSHKPISYAVFCLKKKK